MTPSVEIGHAVNQPMSLAQSAWAKIGEHLENERQRIQNEIRNYPPPIPACDAHFNYLLEERVRIGEELNRMQVAAGESVTPGNSIRLIEEFIASSSYIDDAAKQEIWSWLNKTAK